MIVIRHVTSNTAEFDLGLVAKDEAKIEMHQIFFKIERQITSFKRTNKNAAKMG